MAIQASKFFCLLRRRTESNSYRLLFKNRSFTLTQSLNNTHMTNGANSNQNSPNNSGANGSGNVNRDIGWNGTKIDSAFLARQFINTLDSNERRVIKEELIRAEAQSQLVNGIFTFLVIYNYFEILIAFYNVTRCQQSGYNAEFKTTFNAYSILFLLKYQLKRYLLNLFIL